MYIGCTKSGREDIAWCRFSQGRLDISIIKYKVLLCQLVKVGVWQEQKNKRPAYAGLVLCGGAGGS